VLRAAVHGGGGRKPANLTPASEYLEDEDLLEILNAGLIPTVVVDGHKATFWKQVFPKIVIRVRFLQRGTGKDPVDTAVSGNARDWTRMSGSGTSNSSPPRKAGRRP
jgi:hypothetical protein